MTSAEALREWSDALARFFAESGSVAALLVSTDGKVLQANAAFRRMAGEGVQGAALADLVQPESLPALELLVRGGLAAQRLSFKTPRGGAFLLTCRAYQKPGRLLVVGEAPSLSESELLRAMSRLNAEVGNLGRDLERKNRELREALDEHRRADELREASRRKDEFLAVLSHELRNPLTPIQNGLYLLERAPPGSDRARRAREVVGRQVGHLARLVDDLLDVTRVARGKIHLRRSRVDLGEVVRKTSEDLRSLLSGRAFRVDVGAQPLWVEGDATRLAQVVGNLLNNAAKFTPQGGAVRVTLGRLEGRARLEVEDTGIGISAHDQEHLFEPFAQADRSLDRSRGGLGLGLALVKGIVDLHGGQIRAHSAGAGRGAKLTVLLPLAVHVEAAVEPATAQAAPGHAQRRVLIIEDNRDTAQSLAQVLEIAGHRVSVAYVGAAGLAQAREFHPEIVLCDIGLPEGMDGYAVARAFRRDASLHSIRLVALTGYALQEDHARALRAGFDEHIGKPPDLGSLLRMIERAPAHLPRRAFPA